MAVDTADAVLPAGVRARPARGRKIWSATWPKLVAVAIFIGVWQIVVWSGWKPEYIIPSPFTVFDQLAHDLGYLTSVAWVTMRRAIVGFAVAIVIGGIVGIAVSRSRILRAAVGSMITGLQTMPSVAWYPLAIVLFQPQSSGNPVRRRPRCGAVDRERHHRRRRQRPADPVAGRLGARRLRVGALTTSSSRRAAVGRERTEAGLGVRVAQPDGRRAHHDSPGSSRPCAEAERVAQNADYVGVYEAMIVIFVIGVVIDALFFGTIVRAIRRATASSTAPEPEPRCPRTRME